MISRFLAFFSLAHTMAKMSLKAEAYRLYLSYLWWLLEPLLFVLVYYVVFGVLLKNRPDDFLVFLVVGKIPFMWFSKSVNQASNSLVSNKGMISSGRFNLSTFPVVKILQAFYKQIAVFVMLIIIVLVLGHPPIWSWLWLPLIVLTQFMVIVLCSHIGALLVLLARDFDTLIGMGTLFLLFTSGVFWDVRDIQDPAMQELVLTINPLAFLLDAYRSVLLGTGPGLDVWHLLGILFGAFLLFIPVLMFMTKYHAGLTNHVVTAS